VKGGGQVSLSTDQSREGYAGNSTAVARRPPISSSLSPRLRTATPERVLHNPRPAGKAQDQRPGPQFADRVDSGSGATVE
jgi:hypothetical protein